MKHASLVRPVVAGTQQGPKQDVASVDTEREQFILYEIVEEVASNHRTSLV